VTAQLSSLLDLISPRTGIIKSLNLRPRTADQPELPFVYDAELSHFDFRKRNATERGACGKGVREEDAMLGAIGEAIERYCAAHAAVGSAMRAPLAKCPGPAVSPREFVLYSETQYQRSDLGFVPWTPDSELLWIQAQIPGSAERAWVPAVFAYLTQPSDQPQDMLCAVTSSGFAAGQDELHALRSAVLELIERDAFMITWLNRLPVAEIVYADLAAERNGHAVSPAVEIAADIYASFARWGVEIRAFALATDLPATAVMAIGLDDSGKGPSAVVGLACDLDPAKALLKAQFEICQLYPFSRKRALSGAAERLTNYATVHTLEDHAAYFFRDDHLHEMDFLLKNNRRISLDEIGNHGTGCVQADIDLLHKALGAAGCRLFYRNVTTPDLESYPIRVVRAMITELQPIHFGHNLERRGGSRLYRLPATLGYATEMRSEVDLNPCPHPLA
jgi:ribosomal protein S12 methylthiotransferase accessory factor